MTPHLCTTCGSIHKPPRIYKHPLTTALVSALRKFHAAALYYGKNDIHIRKEMADCEGAPFQLNKDEWTNFSKLRFHALVAHKRVNGKVKDGRWVLTTRGVAFLKGQARVPKWVKTCANRVLEGSLGHSTELTGIRDFQGKAWEIEKKEDIEPEPQVERLTQQALIL